MCGLWDFWSFEKIFCLMNVKRRFIVDCIAYQPVENCRCINLLHQRCSFRWINPLTDAFNSLFASMALSVGLWLHTSAMLYRRRNWFIIIAFKRNVRMKQYSKRNRQFYKWNRVVLINCLCNNLWMISFRTIALRFDGNYLSDEGSQSISICQKSYLTADLKMIRRDNMTGMLWKNDKWFQLKLDHFEM